MKKILKFINENPREVFGTIFIAFALFCLGENRRWLILALLPVLWARRDSYEFPVKSEIENYWHAAGWTLRAIAAYFICPHECLAIYAFYFWIVFDGSYNLFTSRKWHYIGADAELDKFIRFIGGNWIKYAGGLLSSGYTLLKLYY